MELMLSMRIYIYLFLKKTLLRKTGGNVPNISIEIDKLTPESLGAYMYFCMKACAMGGYLLGINPFNQPGVEVYKKNMFHLLGKKGY